MTRSCFNGDCVSIQRLLLSSIIPTNLYLTTLKDLGAEDGLWGCSPVYVFCSLGYRKKKGKKCISWK